MLGFIIEVVSGMPLDEFAKNIFEPLECMIHANPTDERCPD